MKSVLRKIYKVAESLYGKLIPDEELARRIGEEYAEKYRTYIA